jgi:rRNA maturation endonuclease Nob1
MTDNKSTKPAAKTTETKAPAKTKAKPRTLEERIAELQAQADARAAKAKAKAELEFKEVEGKYTRAVSQATKFAGELRDLSAKHGFTLPAGITPPTAGDVEAAQVELAHEVEGDSDQR